MPASNNRGIVTIRNVTRTAVAMERLGKHVSAEPNSRNNGDVFWAVRAGGYRRDKEDHFKSISSRLSEVT
jgi:hypothetical protein